MREGTRKIERALDPMSDKTHLFVFSPSREDRLYQLQMDALSERKCALGEYDIEVDEILESDVNESDLRTELGITPGQFKVVLVGKDSSIKMTAESCISCEEVIMRIQNEPQLMVI